MPTDPIPQQYDPYAHGAGPGEVGAQQTVLHGGQPYDYVPQPPRRSKAGLMAVVVLVVLVLGGGGGFAAWYVIKNNVTPRTGPGMSASQSVNTPSPSVSTPSSPVSATLDPHKIKVGDCIVNEGTEAKPQVKMSGCTTPKSYKVIKKVEGPALVRTAQGTIDVDTTVLAACAKTGYERYYKYDDNSDDTKDVVFCLTVN
jgi:hypothetical protein